MHFKITYNTGKDRFVRTKSKAEAEEVAARLLHVKKIGKIRRFEALDFDYVTPDDISKEAE